MRDAGIADRVMRELIEEKRAQIRALEEEIRRIEESLRILWESLA